MPQATCDSVTGARPQTSCELADIVRLYGPAYRSAHRLPLTHLKVLQAIESCRTAALGGHRVIGDNYLSPLATIIFPPPNATLRAQSSQGQRQLPARDYTSPLPASRRGPQFGSCLARLAASAR